MVCLPMNKTLAAIQARIDLYQSELDKIVKEYHDEMSMAYFSDRFGPDHPMSHRSHIAIEGSDSHPIS